MWKMSCESKVTWELWKKAEAELEISEKHGMERNKVKKKKNKLELWKKLVLDHAGAVLEYKEFVPLERDRPVDPISNVHEESELPVSDK